MVNTYSDQESVRREELESLQNMGIDPYPSESFITNTTSQDVIDKYEEYFNNKQILVLAGRLMNKRIMGKASFAVLQDNISKIQLYLNFENLGDSVYNEQFKKLSSIGDIVGIHGYAFKTKTGEISIHVIEFKILSKALRPIPLPKEKDGIIHDAFTDPEQRYRMRYVDLIVNQHIKNTFILRSKMIRTIRNILDDYGYLEVETPILQPVYGGASARPFTTYHNTLDMPLYLRIANELYLKKLIVGGFDGVYEFAKDFRNEGMSRFHNPEFTMMELYVAYKDYIWMMSFTEKLIEKIAISLHNTTIVKVGEHEINFKSPWARLSLYDAIEKYSGINVSNLTEEELLSTGLNLGLKLDQTMGRGKLLDEYFSFFAEPKLIQPTFITDYPVEMSPLAKNHRDKPGLVERFEVICNGKEICNAFSELNNPIEQRIRFEDQLKQKQRGDDEAMALDEDFLRALEYGMPPTAGIGIGIDRLAMIMTNSNSIQDVIFFPQMRPENK